jgi:hypothetical protein
LNCVWLKTLKNSPGHERNRFGNGYALHQAEIRIHDSGADEEALVGVPKRSQQPGSERTGQEVGIGSPGSSGTSVFELPVSE